MDAEGVGTRCRRRIAAERRTVSDNDSPTLFVGSGYAALCFIRTTNVEFARVVRGF